MIQLERAPARIQPEVTERVAAFVVTYRRPALLRASLDAILRQSRNLDAVIVINNDPQDGPRPFVDLEFSGVEVVDLAENLGSAGGFARALYIASRCGYTWAWLLDDDAVAEPNALAELLDTAGRLREEGHAVGMAAPIQISTRGPFGGAVWRHRIVTVPAARRNGSRPFPIDLAYWAGLLVHTGVVEAIGYPRSEFFRCYADYEYCLRARRAGFEIIAVPGSRVTHHEGLYRTIRRFGRMSIRRGYPPDRFYYDARNAAYTAWHTLRSPLAVAFQVARQCRQALGDLVYEDHKVRRLALRLRGTADGLRGRLGRVDGIE